MKHISAGLAVICDGQILLVQQQGDPTGHHLSIPKGLISEGETPLEAAIRETYEETGLKLSANEIGPKPYLMNIDTPLFKRRVIYYVAILKDQHKPNPMDKEEILWAGFVGYKEAEHKLQITQLSVLMHLNPDKLPTRATDWLCANGFMTCESHHDDNLQIYNYTAKCKVTQLWDEITLWSRGLIVDKDNNIRYRPLKKFFEESQMYLEFIPKVLNNFLLFEKKDGALGILYWTTAGHPYIATRGSFNTLQAINGTRILYNKYYKEIKKLDKTYTYFFEIIYPKDKHVVDYGDTENLFLIGAFDNISKTDVLPSQLSNLKFPTVKQIDDYGDWSDLNSIDIENEEGYVAYFEDGTRIKIKFDSYKTKHAVIFG